MCVPRVSVKSPKENEWMLDPVVIADTYGPEVCVCLMIGGLISILRLINFIIMAFHL